MATKSRTATFAIESTHDDDHQRADATAGTHEQQQQQPRSRDWHTQWQTAARNRQQRSTGRTNWFRRSTDARDRTLPPLDDQAHNELIDFTNNVRRNQRGHIADATRQRAATTSSSLSNDHLQPSAADDSADVSSKRETFWTAGSDLTALEEERLLNGIDMRQVLLNIHQGIESKHETSSSSSSSTTCGHVVDLQQRTAHLDQLARLRLVWRTFKAYSNLGQDDRDLTAALTFLHYLTAPSSTSMGLNEMTASDGEVDMEARLRASLECLSDLLETVLSHSDVAVAPTWQQISGSSIPQHVSLRVIILRTIASLALRIDQLQLALRSTTSLLTLRSQFAVPVKDTLNTPDVELAKTVVTRIKEKSRQHRQLTYGRPRHDLQDEFDGLLTSSVQLWYALKNVVAPVVHNSDQVRLQFDLQQSLDAFTDEAILKYRPDIVASIWTMWALDRGWCLGSQATIAVVKWANGTGFRRSQLSPASRSFYDSFITQTTINIVNGVCDSWTNDERSDLILSLVNGPNTPRTLSACQRVFNCWLERFGPSEFILTAKVSLKLATLATKFGQQDFAKQVASNFIKSRMSIQNALNKAQSSRKQTLLDRKRRASPKSIVETIPHTDLTTLTGLYSLVGDHASVDEVFRHMLRSKMLPDSKDIDVLMTWAASSTQSLQDSTEQVDNDKPEHDALTQVLKHAKNESIQLTIENFQKAVKAILRQPATTNESIELKMQRLKLLFDQTRSFGLSTDDREVLRVVIKSYLVSHRRELGALRRIEVDQVQQWRQGQSITNDASTGNNNGDTVIESPSLYPMTILRPPKLDLGDLTLAIKEGVCLPTFEVRRRSNNNDKMTARMSSLISDVVSRARVMNLLLDCRKFRDAKLAIETFLFVVDRRRDIDNTSSASFDDDNQLRPNGFYDDGMVRILFKTILTGWRLLSDDERRVMGPRLERVMSIIVKDAVDSVEQQQQLHGMSQPVTRKDTIDMVLQVAIVIMQDQNRVQKLLHGAGWNPSQRQRRAVDKWLSNLEQNEHRSEFKGEKELVDDETSEGEFPTTRRVLTV
ncbi:hypothetical protein OIO90_003703 [Microbotryomycetes sp. JL221]|nr:hypothetical protein OIO90_003703 [Microbotryomycetes sp. JL221]